AVAGREEGKRDAIAFLQRPAQRIRRDPLAERMHHARELVPRHLPHVRARVVVVVAPVVEVRAADGGGGVLDENAARPDLGRRQRFELERLAGLVQNGGQSLGHVSLLLVRWHGRSATVSGGSYHTSGAAVDDLLRRGTEYHPGTGGNLMKVKAVNGFARILKAE